MIAAVSEDINESICGCVGELVIKISHYEYSRGAGLSQRQCKGRGVIELKSTKTLWIPPPVHGPGVPPVQRLVHYLFNRLVDCH